MSLAPVWEMQGSGRSSGVRGEQEREKESGRWEGGEREMARKIGRGKESDRALFTVREILVTVHNRYR